MTQEIERRAIQEEKLNQLTIIAASTQSDVRELKEAFYGRNGKEGFIGETTTALTVQKKSLSILWKFVWCIFTSTSLVGLSLYFFKSSI